MQKVEHLKSKRKPQKIAQKKMKDLKETVPNTQTTKKTLIGTRQNTLEKDTK